MTRSVHVLADPHAVARAAADRFVDLATTALAARGRFIISLAGGSTPKETYRLLATPGLCERVDWARLIVLFGDERCVPPDHADSNYRMAKETLLGHAPIPPDQILRMKGELTPKEAAADYERLLSEVLGGAEIDLALLGLGPDGHTASLFPGTEALEETSAHVVASYVPKFAAWRLTLTARYLSTARHVLFLVAGPDKAEALQLALEAPPVAVPAQLVRAEEMEWLVDRAAASKCRSLAKL
jgi:6-phosphogluconolactonase